MFLTKKCPNCGNLVQKDDLFCLNCGALVEEGEAVEAGFPTTEAVQPNTLAPLAQSSTPVSNETPSPAPARLTIIKGAREGAVFPLTAGRLAIGRSKTGNDLVLNDPQASRNHAVITSEKTAVSIRDLGSTNGTIVNGKPITSQALLDGDVIEIGDTVLVFHD